MKHRFRLLLTTLLPLAFVPIVQAHPGHGPGGFISGLGHPFSGLDHLLAMVAVGLWAAQLGGRGRWLVPIAFVGAMTIGACVGRAGFVPPGTEWGIVGSVIVLGLMVAVSLQTSPGIGATLVAIGGAMHGFAHGAEMPAGSNTIAFLGGMILATAVPHATGVFAAVTAGERGRIAVRFAGVGIAAAGAILIAR